MAGKKLTRKKAKKIRKHGKVHGKPLTPAQEGFFGRIAGGGTPTRLKKKGKKRG